MLFSDLTAVTSFVTCREYEKNVSDGNIFTLTIVVRKEGLLIYGCTTRRGHTGRKFNFQNSVL